MKKKYESPLAEKYEFNYIENVVASVNAKQGNNNYNGCFSKKNSYEEGCIAKEK